MIINIQQTNNKQIKQKYQTSTKQSGTNQQTNYTHTEITAAANHYRPYRKQLTTIKRSTPQYLNI